MYHKQLVKHILLKKSDSVSENDIRNELSGDGWSKEDIDQAFFYADNPEQQKLFSFHRVLHSEVSASVFIFYFKNQI